MKVITDREYDAIILHCSDSDRLAHDNVETITKWHKENGWDDIGYHYVITKTRGVEVGRNLTEIGAHVKGHNRHAIGICLTGKRLFTEGQFEAVAALICELMQVFNISVDRVLPHSFYNMGKTCPNYKVKKDIIPKVKELLVYGRIE